MSCNLVSVGELSIYIFVLSTWCPIKNGVNQYRNSGEGIKEKILVMGDKQLAI